MLDNESLLPRWVLLEARVTDLEARQREHRAILVGDDFGGTGGIRAVVQGLSTQVRALIWCAGAIILLLAPAGLRDLIGLLAGKLP